MTTQRKARRLAVCLECQEIIEVGSPYYTVDGQDTILEYHICMDCAIACGLDTEE